MSARRMEQICYGSFVWVIIFLPFWGSPSDPPLPRSPPANACTFESGTLPCLSPVIIEERPGRAPAEKGMHFGSDSAGYDFSQTKWKNRSATSRLHPRLQSKTIKAVGPIEERPGGRVRSASLTFSLPSGGRERELRSLTGARVPPVTRLSNQVTILGPGCSLLDVLASIWWT